MKDKSEDPDIHDLRPCPLSVRCLRLVDELDGGKSTRLNGSVSLEDEQQDMLLLEELRAHLPTCPACTAALEQAREIRDQQRNLLRNVLKEGEQRVPSTTAQIFLALRREQEEETQPLWLAAMHNHHQPAQAPEETPTVPALPTTPAQPAARKQEKVGQQVEHAPIPVTPRRRVRKTLRFAVSLAAAAAIILVTFAVLASLIWLRHAPATSTSPKVVTASTAIRSSKDWTGLVVTSVQQNRLAISLYDANSGQSASVASVPARNSAFDGVSHDGQKLLYHVYNGTQTVYHLWYLGESGAAKDSALYTYNGKSGAAIFRSYDDQYIFVSTPAGVAQVDSVSGSAKMILPALKSPSLQFYRNGYLYLFESNLPAPLKRANVGSGVVQRISPCAVGSTPWISTGGASIYYTCLGSQDLYAMNSDGTNQHLQRAGAGAIVGYADDNVSILALDQPSKGVNALMKYGADVSQDQILTKNVAPGAQQVLPADVAVAPFGHAVVAKGSYANGQVRTWYSDLVEGITHEVFLPDSSASLALPGWAKLQIPSAPQAAQTGPGSPYDSWNNVVMLSSDQQTGLSHIISYDTHSGTTTQITSRPLPLNTIVDGVSHNGLNVLYQYPSGGKMLYWTMSQLAGTGYFYALDDNDAGNAVWMPDNRNVLIATQKHGIIKVDITTGAASSVLPTLTAGKLVIYRDPYLYYIGAQDVATGALYRVNITDGTPQQVTGRSPNSMFWVSPDGSTVYYVNKGAAGQAGVYAVNNDGSNLRLLRSDGVPIGYASDNTLMLVRDVKGAFRVVRLGASADQDQTLLSDIAPGATALCDAAVSAGDTPICDSSIALAPLGGSLVVEATYPDGAHKLWYIDLQTGKRLELPISAGQVQLIGWDGLASS